MKRALVLSFLCISIHAMALKDETPPVLKQLFAIYPFGSGLQPLGIFDTTVHNSHPLAVINSLQTDTWYMRSADDTSNGYTWEHGNPKAIGDFNGDGFQDYWMYKGGIHVGRGIGIRPDTIIIPSRTLPEYVYTFDYNVDGYDDITLFSNGALGASVNDGSWGAIGLGTTDLSKIKYIPFHAPKQAKLNSYTLVLQVYPKGSEWRIVWEESGTNLNKYCVGRLVFTDTAMFVEPLSEMHCESRGSSGWSPFCNASVYVNRNTQEATFLAMYCQTGADYRSCGINVFSLDRDTFDIVKNYPYLRSFVFSFQTTHSVPYDDRWVAQGEYPGEGSTDFVLNLFQGSPRNAKRIGRTVDLTHNGGINEFQCVGDITNDGIPDYSMVKGSSLYFFDGAPLSTEVQTVDVTERDVVAEPHPVQLANKFHLKLPSDLGGSCSILLYKLNGEQVVSLYDNFIALSNEAPIIPLEIRDVPAGTYFLKVNISKVSRVIKIMVVE